jgi:UDP:flavonoid glycosyltransferase YjiC (YdhE family)
MFEAGLVPASLRPPVPLGRWLPAGMRRWLANQGPLRVRDGCEALDAVAAELGVEGVPSLAALLMGDLTLVTDVPELTGLSAEALAGWTPRDPSRYRRAPRLRYTGPLFARFERPVPERVERFLADDGPVAFVAVTSVEAGFIRGVVAAVRAAGVRALVAGTVPGLDTLDGPGVCVAGVLPSHEVFPRVALGVIAGGQGSVQTALWAGRPFVGIPLQPEQDWNVACAERIGAARRVAPDEAAGPVMTRAVRSLLGDAAARVAAEKAKAWLRAVDGPSRAAEEILAFLDERARSVSQTSEPHKLR